MTFSISIEPCDGAYVASLIGAPDVRVLGDTRSGAIEALRAELERRVESGELVSVDIEPLGIIALAGKYADDPTLRDICEDAYRARDVGW